MDRNKLLKERLDTIYEKPSIWEGKVDFTKVKKVTGKEVEIVDLTGCDLEPLKMELEGNYDWFFEQLKNGLERAPTVHDYYCIYTDLLKGLSGRLTDNMCDIIDEDGIENDKLFKGFLDIVYAHEKEELKLEIAFNEYSANLETFSDMTIKNFPENLTEKEKNILNHLANKFFIKRNLTEKGLLPLFGKNGTKRLLEEFYKFAPECKDFQAFNFIKLSIETNLPDATLQNYCREVRKDVRI